MKCIECVYGILNNCPTHGSRNNAACLTIQKYWVDVDHDELKAQIEAIYQEEIKLAERGRKMRLALIAEE